MPLRKLLTSLIATSAVAVVAVACLGSDRADRTVTVVTSDLPATIALASQTPVTIVAEVTPTAVNSLEPTAEAVPTVVNPTPTVATGHSTAEAAASRPSRELADLFVPGCKISGSIHPVGFGGTAPAPTATPLPEDELRPHSLIREEAADSLAQFSQLAMYSGGVSDVLSSSWSTLLDPEEQAALLWSSAVRLAGVCSALGLVDFPPEISGDVTQFADAVRTRHTWVQAAIDALLSPEDSVDIEDLILGMQTTAAYLTELQLLLSELELVYQPLPVLGDRHVLLETLNGSMDLPAEFILSSSGLEFFALIPDDSTVLDPAELGPTDWERGVSVRIRRIRNQNEIGVGQMAAIYAHLVISEDLSSVVIDDESEVLVWSADGGWTGGSRMILAEPYTYIVEWACNDMLGDSCVLVHTAANSFHVN